LSWRYGVRRALHLARRHAAADAIAFGLPNRTAEFGDSEGLHWRNTGRGHIENLGMRAHQVIRHCARFVCRAAPSKVWACAPSWCCGSCPPSAFSTATWLSRFGASAHDQEYKTSGSNHIGEWRPCERRPGAKSPVRRPAAAPIGRALAGSVSSWPSLP
jgi:hypothetical protein